MIVQHRFGWTNEDDKKIAIKHAFNGHLVGYNNKTNHKPEHTHCRH